MARKVEIQVGVTVLVAVAILLWGVTWLKELTLTRQYRLWHVRFEQTGGLGKGDEVEVNGIKKGQVDHVHLLSGGVLVDIALSSDITLTTDCRVAIRNIGMMGEKLIAVDMVTSGQPYAQKDTIQGIYEKGLPEVMASLGDAVDVINRLTRQLEGVADVMSKNGDFAATVRNFHKTSEELKLAVIENRGSLKSTLDNFAAASKTAKSLTTDREAELRDAMDHFSSAAGKLDQLSGRLDSLRAQIAAVTGKVNRGEGTLGKLVNDDTLYSEVNASVQSLKALVEDIKKNPRKYLTVKVF